MEYKIFGCKVNKFYLSRWLNYFNNYKYNLENKVIIATCVVTDRAKSKWVKEAKKILSEKKEIFITWCSVFDNWWMMDYNKFYEIYYDLKQYKNRITLLPEDPSKANEIIWIGEYDLNNDITEDINLYTKKFVVIQNWCDTHCTFCLTIAKRWPNRSRSEQEIIDEIKKFENIWWKEIVITGINLAAWWCSHTRTFSETKFPALLESIIKNTSIPRIRISSLGPEFLDDRFFEIVTNPRFLPHFHISIQSFSDNILKLMNRNYDSKQIDYVLNKLKNLNRIDKDLVSIWADIIVWFPWETDEDFMMTYNWIMNYNINKLHTFPFSAHRKWESIPAAKFPWSITKEIKTQRESKILELWESIRGEFINKNKWKTWKILLEEQKDWVWSWWTPNYIQVNLKWNYNRWDVVEYKY